MKRKKHEYIAKKEATYRIIGRNEKEKRREKMKAWQ